MSSNKEVTFKDLKKRPASLCNAKRSLLKEEIVERARGFREKNFRKQTQSAIYFNNIKVTVNLQGIRKARSQASYL